MDINEGINEDIKILMKKLFSCLQEFQKHLNLLH